MTDLCRCGHDRPTHLQYTLGSGCTACDCSRWRRPTAPPTAAQARRFLAALPPRDSR